MSTEWLMMFPSPGLIVPISLFELFVMTMPAALSARAFPLTSSQFRELSV
ncbi:MAG TPA: hypothetical protein PLX89_10160 [Verrucomicrobiota bacterium]|nr:hypothetical protein [Verrucomicrobiota bacterium]